MSFIVDVIRYKRIVLDKLGLIGYPATKWSKLPGYVIIGDSLAWNGLAAYNTVAMTASGTEITATSTSHGLLRGAKIYVQDVNEAGYEGVFTIKTIVDANTYKFDVPIAPTVSPATGNRYVSHLNRTSARSFADTAAFMAGRKSLYLGNFGVSGATAANLDAQLDFALSATYNDYGRTPEYVFINVGINDPVASTPLTSAETITYLTAAITRIKAANATPVINTAMPITSSFGAWTVARVQQSRVVNKWIRESSPALGAIVIDANTVCIDNTTQYGDWKTNYSSDGLHLAEKGTYYVGQKIKTVLWDYVEATDDRTFTHIEPNTDLSGTAGSKTGTGASGSVADSMTVSAAGGGSQTAVCSKGIAPSGSGESQRIVFAAAADADSVTFTITSSLHASLAANDKIIARARIIITGDKTNLGKVTLQQSYTIDGFSGTAAAAMRATAATTWGGTDDYDLWQETPIFKIPDPVTGLTSFKCDVVVSAIGAATVTIDISDFEILKVS